MRTTREIALLSFILILLIAPSIASAATGGTITTDGSYTVHTFTSNDTFTPNRSSLVVDYLILGGGGGGGALFRGAGGAGGLLQATGYTVNGAKTVIVGTKGLGGTGTPTTANIGENSSFGDIIATRGGTGHSYTDVDTTLWSGGSGGGGGVTTGYLHGNGIGGQGNDGGDGDPSSPYTWTGGGGGAGSAGSTKTGGSGVQSSISGTALYYAGGGGGSCYQTEGAGSGGSGVGGNGACWYTVGNDAPVANRGSGGGAAGSYASLGGNGSDGVVIIRYLTSNDTVQQYTPPVPVINTVTTGNLWVNTTWTPGSGNVTNSYNVSYNGQWSNGSSNTYKNTTLSGHGWHNVTVYAYNNSGAGTLSATAMTNNTQIPNNLPVMVVNTIVPSTAYTSSTLTATPTATDVDSDTITYYYLWYKDGVATGNTTSTITNLTQDSVYKVFVTPNDGYGNGTGTNSSEVTVVYRWNMVDVVNGVYAVLDTGIPSNPTISTYSNNSILTTDMQVNWDTISSGTWTSLLAAIDYSYSINMRSAIRLNMGGDYTNTTVQNNALANISAYFGDLKTDPYESDVQWIELNFTNTSASSADKGAFANLIAQRITEDTNNRAPIYTIEQVSGLNEANVKYSPIISLNISNDSDFINQEELTLRGNITKSRLYSGNYTLSLLSQYKRNVFNKIRGTISIDHPSESYSVYIDNGVNHDLILFNNQSGTQNLTVSGATGTFLDTTNDIIRTASDSLVYFNVSGNNFSYIINTNVDRIVQNDTSINVYGGTTPYNQTGGLTNGYFDAYIYAGAQTDIKVQLFDPTYVNTPLSMVYYGWLNASIVQNYTDYKYIIIADKNAAVINSTINRPNETYIYVAVADYSDLDQWTLDKQNETDWASDNGYNTFIDGIDFAAGGNNFATRFKQVINHVKSRNKKVILNTYTTYQEFATYGDGIMKESAFSRWDGDVNTPTYSWEDMTLEKQRADFYSSHNLPVILMSFGDVRDYDKMYFDYMAGAVLYGYNGNNSFRYGQPNFQYQRDYPVKPLGTMLEAGFTETSSTDWNRMYANGRVHVNPVAHTAWMDDAKTVNNISFDIYLYSGATGSGDRNVTTTIHQPNGTFYNLTYDNPATGVWDWRKVTLPASEYKEHGQYDIYFATRPSGGGYNFLGKSNTAKKGIYSYHDETAVNINTGNESEYTWQALPIDNNWMVRLNVDYTTDLLIDTMNSGTITQTDNNWTNLNRTVVLNGSGEYNVSIYSDTINIHTNEVESVWFKALNGSWISANLPSLNISDITSNSITTWTETQIDGLTYGIVKAYSDTTHWLVRLLFPNNINQDVRITEPIITMTNPNYNITVITPINVTLTSSDGNTVSFDLNTSTLKLNSSVDFTVSNITYTEDKMLFTVSASSGTLNISSKTEIPNVNYNLIVDNSIVASGTSNETGWVTFAYSGAWSQHNFEVSLDIAAPANLAASTGNFWINWTWDAVSNADDYNIWINGTDIEADTPNLYYNVTYSAHAERTISVRGVNHTTQNFGLWGNITTTIPNNLPVMTSNVVTPDPAYIGNTLTATPSTTDADSDPISYTYNWYKDNELTGITTSTLSDLVSGSSYYVEIIPADGYGVGTLTNSNTVTVTTPTPPTPVIGSVTTGNFWVNTAWSPGSGNVTDSYNVSLNGAWTNGSLPSPINTTYSPHSWQNLTIYAYNNSAGLSLTPLTNNTIIPNNLPVMTGNAITPTTANPASTLTSTTHTATDADSDSITYTYQWYKDGAIFGGQTASTLTSLVSGHSYKVSVTPNDGYDAGSSTFSNEVSIMAGQNTALSNPNTDFGSMLAGTTNYINNTFTLNNKGNTTAIVSARFLTNTTGNYGMVNGTNYLPASGIALESTAGLTYTSLADNGIDVTMGDNVLAGATDQWNIRLLVPAGQTAAIYSGTIELTFTNPV